MALLTNQIRVLLQRVKLAGKEPHRILMHRGLYDVLRNEMHQAVRVKLDALQSFDPAVDKRTKMFDLTFEGIPIIVDDSLSEILIQTKPKKLPEDDLPQKIKWDKIIKVDNL